MARLWLAVGLIGLMTVSVRSKTAEDLLECLREDDSLDCAKRTTDLALDKIEAEVTGRRSPVGVSRVFEQSGALIVDSVRNIFAIEQHDTPEDILDDTGDREARGEFFVKKKKKMKKFAKKILPFLMLLKAKFSLLLQLISTHFQIKFYKIALISLIINAARFWMDLKRGHGPAKVVYYEHAQHQHHYDDDSGYWRRSSENVENDPQDRAYSAWAPQSLNSPY